MSVYNIVQYIIIILILYISIYFEEKHKYLHTVSFYCINSQNPQMRVGSLLFKYTPVLSFVLVVIFFSYNLF